MNQIEQVRVANLKSESLVKDSQPRYPKPRAKTIIERIRETQEPLNTKQTIEKYEPEPQSKSEITISKYEQTGYIEYNWPEF